MPEKIAAKSDCLFAVNKSECFPGISPQCASQHNANDINALALHAR